MTEHRDDKDNDLKAYLEGNDGVSATYDKLGKSEVPGHLDRLILDAAREGGAIKSGSGNSDSYFSQKYSIAASVMICVLIGAIYLTDRDVLQRDSARMPASTTQTESESPSVAFDNSSETVADDMPIQRQGVALRAPETAPAQSDISASTGNAANTEARALGANLEVNRQDASETAALMEVTSDEVSGERVAEMVASNDAAFSPEPITIDQDSLADLVEESIASETSIERQQVATFVDEDTEEVVVTGSRIRTDGMEPPNSVTVATLEELQRLNPESLVMMDGESELMFYRDTPESWAITIYLLSENLTALTRENLAKSSGNGADDNADEVVVTGSRIRVDEVDAGMAVATTNEIPPAVETRQEISPEENLRIQLELERREFNNTYPDMDLDALIEEILSSE